MLNYDHKAIVFKDQANQKKLNDEGFVILDFLTADEVAHLSHFFAQTHPQGVNGFYTSTFSKDTSYRKAVDDEIRRIMQRGLDHYFTNYRVHCGSFIAKGADEKSKLKLHQDMSLVDESIYTGINIWIPLVDLNAMNGAIEILPRSHRIFKTYRGASLPDIYDGVEPLVHSYMKPLYLKSGQAAVFDQSIIHYSPANQSGKVRPVINTFVTHKDASIKICYWDKVRKNEIEIFDQEDDFMVNFQNFGHDIFSRPSIGRSAGFVPFDFPKLSAGILADEYGEKTTGEKQKPFVSLFKKIFSGS